MWSMQDLWGPLCIAWLIFVFDQGCVLSITGAPVCLYCRKSLLAWWLTLSRLAKSSDGRFVRMKSFHPNSVSSSASFSILNWNSPMSCGTVLVNSSRRRLAGEFAVGCDATGVVGGIDCTGVGIDWGKWGWIEIGDIFATVEYVEEGNVSVIIPLNKLLLLRLPEFHSSLR